MRLFGRKDNKQDDPELETVAESPLEAEARHRLSQPEVIVKNEPRVESAQQLLEAAKAAGLVYEIGEARPLDPSSHLIHACPRHEWGLARPGVPLAPAHMCPFCVEEPSPKPPVERTERESETTAGKRTGLVGEEVATWDKPISEAEEAALRRWEQRQAAGNVVRAGSVEEREAVAHIDGKRQYAADLTPRILYVPSNGDPSRVLRETPKQAEARVKRQGKPSPWAGRRHYQRYARGGSSEIILQAD